MTLARYYEKKCHALLVSQVQKELPNAKIVKRISELIENRCKNLKKQGL
jgi:hypothetical protein